ncbi:calcium-binding protein [Testudinibacter sp. P80/BLE/0925]|uniref:calcium-binding protein n=1 Tax=Testudinibacter sp. TW-1 TaxID=3417757 RepID=UPI003D365B19
MIKMMIAKFGADIGTIDGVVETSSMSTSCNGKNMAWSAGLSSSATAASFASGFPNHLGNVGGSISAISTAINVGINKQITASDTFTILAGVAGAFGLGVPALIFAVGGLAVTLYDNANHRDANGCVKPPSIPLGDLISPSDDNPNTDRGKNTPLSCPLIIDMDKNGVKTISITKNTFFDLDNNLFAENTGWIDKGDAFLVWDRNGNGTIDSGHELFGNHTVLKDGNKANNGFLALTELDSNHNNIFDEKDEAWFTLQLWFDHNQNGIAEEGELIKLSESGIKSIDLSYIDIAQIDESGNIHKQQSQVIWEDDSTSDITDIWFNVNTAKSYYKEKIEINNHIKEMPNIIAFGNLLNLHEAIAKNPNLIYVIQEYIEASPSQKKELINHLIYEWAGVSHIEESSRGDFINAKKLHTLEILTGEAFKQQGRNSNPNKTASTFLENEFNKFSNYVYAQLESKTSYKDLFNITHFNINASGELEFNWDKLNSEIILLANDNKFQEAREILLISKNLGSYNNDYLKIINTNLTQLAEKNKIISYILNTDITLGKDLLIGTDKKDFLVGSVDNDMLEAKDGDDFLFGGAGNDILNGDLGSDTYIFSKGHGQDIIKENHFWMRLNEKDTIHFTNINYSDVKFRQIDNDLILFGYNQNDSITIKQFYADEKYQVENFQFLDRFLSLKEILTKGIVMSGTDKDDITHKKDGSTVEDNTKINHDPINVEYPNNALTSAKAHNILNENIGIDAYI